MSIRSTNTTRNLDTRKSSVPTIGRGAPLNKQGAEGDFAFRTTSDGLKLYIKANAKWHGVKVGESFSSIEKELNNIKSKVNLIKSSGTTETYASVGNMTFDSGADIELNADGGQVTIKDNTANHFLFDCDNTAFTIYDDQDEGDLFKIQVAQHGATTISTTDDDATAANLTLDINGDIILDAFTDIILDSRNGVTKFYVNGDTDDLCTLTVAANGVTTLATADSDGTAANFTLDADGDIELNSETGIINIKDNLTKNAFFKSASLNLLEQSGAHGDLANYGQIWIKNDTPNNLYFTDDAGNDIQLTSGLAPAVKYQYETKVTNFYATATANFLPLAGYVFEKTSLASSNEFVAIVAPYNGTLERAVFRSEIAQNGDLIFALHESADGTEVPALGAVGSKTTAINIADDTSVVVDFDSMTSGSNVITKGRIYAIKLTTPSGPQDTNVSLVFKWDVTS